MPPKLDQKISDAIFKLAARHTWHEITFDQIAKAAKIPAKQIKQRYADTNALLPLMVAAISGATMKTLGNPDKRAALHDRLFEALMARFDVLQKHREAILNLAAAAHRDARVARHLARAQMQAIKSTLLWADEISDSGNFSLSSTVLWVVYLASFRVWKNDETLDMSKTMAALDRYLRLAMRVLNCHARL